MDLLKLLSRIAVTVAATRQESSTWALVGTNHPFE